MDSQGLQLAKSPQSAKDMVLNGLLISDIKSLNITNLFDNSVKPTFRTNFEKIKIRLKIAIE